MIFFLKKDSKNSLKIKPDAHPHQSPIIRLVFHLNCYFDFNAFFSKALFCSLLIFCFQLSFAQQEAKKIIEIIQAEELEITEDKDIQIRKLKGAVILKQDDVILKCDSAIFFPKRNGVEAYGDVYIEQGDSLDIYADYLFYNGNTKIIRLYDEVLLKDETSEIKSDSLIYNANTKKAVLHQKVHLTDQKINVYADSLEYFVNTKQAELYDNVRLIDGESEITAHRMSYNVDKQKGTYTGGGKMVNEGTTLTSEEADYNGQTKKVHFKKNVHLVSPDYDLTTPDLTYDIDTEISTFKGHTTIISEESTIVTNAGTYDTKNQEIKLQDRTTVVNEEQQITADDFFYNKTEKYGVAKGNVEWTDTSSNLTINSQYAQFFDGEEKVLATGDALMTNISESGDTLYLTADTLLAFTDTITVQVDSMTSRVDSFQVFYAYHNAKILNAELQGICDSLVYSFRDSVFQMYQDPVIWSDAYQLSADTIRLFTQNGDPDMVELRQNSFITNEVQAGVYNQVKGRDITGYFKDKVMDYMDVEGDAESVFFVQDDKDAFVGVNKSNSSSMELHFAEKKVDKIKFITKPIADFVPMSQVQLSAYMLAGFRWRVGERPNVVADLVVIETAKEVEVEK